MRFLARRKRLWMHGDALARCRHIETDEDLALLADLPRLMREDPDPDVRRAALLRGADLGLAQERSLEETDPALRRCARELYLDLWSGRHARAPVLDDRLRLLRAQDDPVLLQHLARQAWDVPLREAALERLDSESLFAERAVEDADAGLRARTLARVHDPDLLQRVSEIARSKDRHVSRLAGQRLQQARIEAGDPAAVAEHTARLCRALEAAATRGQAVQVTLSQCRQAWQAIEAHVPPALAQRYRNACEVLEASTPEAIERRRAAQAFRERLDALETEKAPPPHTLTALMREAEDVLVSGEIPEDERDRMSERLSALVRRTAARA